MRIQKNPHRWDIVTFLSSWGLPTLISLLLFFPTEQVILPSDGSLYTSIGINLHNGNGLTGPDWLPVRSARPGLPGLLAFAFSIFDVSIQTAFYATRIFYPLTIGVVFWLGNILSNRWCGLIAALLIVTSPSLSFWAALIHLDHIMPFFMLLYLGFSYKGLQTQKLSHFVIAGFCLGIGFLVKEVALLVFPVPWLTWLFTKNWRNRAIFLRLSLLTALLAVIVGSWLAYDATNTENVQSSSLAAAATVAQSTAETSSSVTDSDEVSWQQLLRQALNKYYDQYMQPNFGLAPYLLMGWLYILIRSIWGSNSSDTYLSSLFLVLSIFAIMQGIIGQRERHGIILFQSSYIAFAYAFTCLFKDIKRLFSAAESSRTYSIFWQITASSIILCCIGYQVGYESVRAGTFREYSGAYNTLEFLQNSDRTIEFSTTFGGEQAISLAGEWLQENVSPGSVLITDYSLYTDLFFYSDGQFPIYELTNPGVNWYIKQASYLVDDTSNSNSTAYKDTYSPLFMWFRPNQNIDSSRRAMYMVSEEVWLSDMAKKSVDYVIVSPTFNVFSMYFMHSPSFSKVAEFGNGEVEIYQVNALNTSPTLLPPITNVKSGLNNLKRENPERYKYFVTDFFSEYLKWENSQLSEFFSSNNGQFRLGQPFRSLDYYNKVAQLPISELSMLISHREQILNHAPEPWGNTVLSGLYMISGNESKANLTFSKVQRDGTTDNVLLLENFAEAQLAYINSSSWQLTVEERKRRYIQALQLHPNLSVLQQELLNIVREFSHDQQFIAEVQGTAETHYLQRTRTNEVDINNFLNLADLYQELGMFDLALRYYLNAAEEFQDAVEPFESLGVFYSQTGESYLAIMAYEQALSLKPDEITYYDSLAKLFQQTGQHDKAIQILKTAANVFPNAAWPHLELGHQFLSEIE